MSRSVNTAVIIGNLTRDPEMRYTPQGHAVTSFGVATNRTWVSDGERKEEVEFHNVVAWNKLAELCHQLLAKGRRVYIQGRLQTRSWEGADGVRRSKTEIVADDMVILDDKYKQTADYVGSDKHFRETKRDQQEGAAQAAPAEPARPESSEAEPASEGNQGSSDEIKVEDIPF